MVGSAVVVVGSAVVVVGSAVVVVGWVVVVLGSGAGAVLLPTKSIRILSWSSLIFIFCALFIQPPFTWV